MRLADKIRYLREVEGNLRGLNRAMTQQELVHAIQAANHGRKATGSISQSYLSQLESGKRPHLTNTTRMLLARFFKVHPGYLVDDPEGYQPALAPGQELRAQDFQDFEDKLDLWLVSGVERFRRDAELSQALLTLAHHHDSRRCLLLMEAIVETPALLDRLFDALRPAMKKRAALTAKSAAAKTSQAPPPATPRRRQKGSPEAHTK